MYQAQANDQAMELIYGTKTPHIDVRGPEEGCELFHAHQIRLWIETWSRRSDIDAEVHARNHLDLPEGVDKPLVDFKYMAQILKGVHKSHRGFAIIFEETFSENFSIYSDYYHVWITTGTVPQDEDM